MPKGTLDAAEPCIREPGQCEWYREGDHGQAAFDQH
jgi:hypothetical protein